MTLNFPAPLGLTPRRLNNRQAATRFASTRNERDFATHQYEWGMPGVRLFLSQSIESDDPIDQSAKWRLKAIVWDSEKERFALRSERFVQSNAHNFQKRSSIVSSELPYSNSCQLSEGYFLDREMKRIILPNGNWIDGPTGKLYTCHGEPVSGKDTFQKDC